MTFHLYWWCCFGRLGIAVEWCRGSNWSVTGLSFSWDPCSAADPSWSLCPSFEVFFLLVWYKPSLYQKAFGISHTVVCGVITDDWQEECSAASSSMLPAANLYYWELRIQKHLLCVAIALTLQRRVLWACGEGKDDMKDVKHVLEVYIQIASVFYRLGFAFLCVPHASFPWGYLLLGIIGS